MPNQSDLEDSEELSTDSIGGVDLIYKLEGRRSEVDVFELSRVLDSFGNVLKESYRLSHPNEGELLVKVKPFEEGSFIMDIALSIQRDPTYLFFLAHPDVIKYTRETLEALGFIRKIGEKSASLLELLRKLKNGKPEKVVQTGPNDYDFHAGDGSVVPVNSTVNALYNNPVINNYTFNIVAPAEHESVKNILTYLKAEQERTSVTFDRDDAKAVRAYAEPPVEIAEPEVLEDTTTKILSPKSGNYGQTTGRWSFTIAGTRRTIKAKISAQDFLAKYSSGTIRFYQGDRLKVRLKETQTTVGQKTTMEYDIVDVLEYHQAHPAAR